MKKNIILILFLSSVITISARVSGGEDFDKRCRHRLEKYNYKVTIEKATVEIENNMFLRENYTYRGYSKLLSGDFKGAIEDFNEVIKMDAKNSWEALLHRGYTYACQKNFFLAKADFQKFAATFPKDTNVFYYLGTIKFLENDFKGAILEFDKQLLINSKDIDCFYSRGESKMNQMYIRESLDDFSKVIEINPKSFEGYYGRGTARTKLQEYKQALKDFDKALVLMQEANATPVQRVKYSDSQPEVENVNGMQPEFLEIAYSIYNNRGNAKMDAKDYTNAILDFDQAIKINKNKTSAYNNRAICKVETGDLPGGYDDYCVLISLRPDSPEIYFNRGVVRLGLNDLKGAIEDYTESLKLNPKNGQVYYNRGKAKKQMKKLTEACEDFERANTYGFKEFESGVTSGCK